MKCFLARYHLYFLPKMEMNKFQKIIDTIPYSCYNLSKMLFHTFEWLFTVCDSRFYPMIQCLVGRKTKWQLNDNRRDLKCIPPVIHFNQGINKASRHIPRAEKSAVFMRIPGSLFITQTQSSQVAYSYSHTPPD